MKIFRISKLITLQQQMQKEDFQQFQLFSRLKYELMQLISLA